MDGRPPEIPFASLVVIAAFVTGAMLAPQALDLLWPAETAPPNAAYVKYNSVVARLWEDPFTAIARAQTELSNKCQQAATGGSGQAAGCALPATGDGHGKPLDSWLETTRRKALVLAVLLPGNSFVGAEEARRRTRYALLSGLGAESYVPDDDEHIHLFAVKLTAPGPGTAGTAATQGATVPVPYETLSYRPARDSNAKPAPYDGVVVMWIDETALPAPALDAFARLLGRSLPRASACRCDFKLIGPTRSDSLRLLLQQFQVAAGNARTLDSERRIGYEHLANGTIHNAFCTAPLSYILPEARYQGDDSTSTTIAAIRTILRQNAAAFTGKDPPDAADEQAARYISTIGVDKDAVDAIAGELAYRGPGAGDVILISEWDDLYTKALQETFKARLQSKTSAVRSFHYLRGIDGATLSSGHEASTSTAPTSDAATSSQIAASSKQAGWPEAQDQRDYVRRLARQLHAQELNSAQSIRAIGVIGSDVHDKLLVLQALREEFPDKIIFTTDLDSRFLHPQALPFSRNLLVASSLPLEGSTTFLRDSSPIPPMRDVYQVSTYLAARAATGAGNVDLPGLESLISRPFVYEIGRSEVHCLPPAGFGSRSCDPTATAQGRFAIAGRTAALLMPIAAILGMLVWPSTPGMRSVLLGRSDRPVRGATPDAPQASRRWHGFGEILYCSLIAALLSFLLGAGLEMAYPGRVSTIGLRESAAFTFLLFEVVAVVLNLANRHRPASVWMNLSAWAAGAAAIVSPLGVYLAFATPPDPPPVFEPLLLFEGISGWPSQVLWAVALVIAAAAIDYAWYRDLRAMERLGDRLHLRRAGTGRRDPEQAQSGPAGAWPLALQSVRRLIFDAVRGPARFLVEFVKYSWMFGWQYRNTRGGQQRVGVLWNCYLRYANPSQHLARIVIGSVSVGVFLLALEHSLDPSSASSPIRGLEDRAIILWTQLAAFFALVILIVMVMDSTILGAQFIWNLSRSRSTYSNRSLRRVAGALGGGPASGTWLRRLQENPADRGTGGGSHCLLDDWIDIEVIAVRTDNIEGLILAPFVVLALFLVARSNIFDNWAVTRGRFAVIVVLAAMLFVCAVALNRLAERARRIALERMSADLRWLEGSGPEWSALSQQFNGLIAAVKANRTGAFAPIFDQPIVRALLVPLGSVGGTQLLEYFFLTR